MKTAIVFGFAETAVRRFIDNPTAASIPDIARARALAAGEVPKDVTSGVAQVSGNRYLWGADNPTVEPAGPDRISCRAINVVALTLGALQLWVVKPVLVNADYLRLPQGSPSFTLTCDTVRSGPAMPVSIRPGWSRSSRMPPQSLRSLRLRERNELPRAPAR